MGRFSAKVKCRQCGGYLREKLGERRRQRPGAGDEDVIVTGPRDAPVRNPQRLLEASSNAIAAHGSGGLLRYGEAEAGRRVVVSVPRHSLQPESASRMRDAALRRAQEIAPASQPLRRGLRRLPIGGGVRLHASRSSGREACPGSGRQAFAPARPPRGDDIATADGGHARAKSVTALAHDLAGLIGSFHRCSLRSLFIRRLPSALTDAVGRRNATIVIRYRLASRQLWSRWRHFVALAIAGLTRAKRLFADAARGI